MPKLIDHGRRRQELVDAAWALIAFDGIDAATVRHVAERAGVAAGSVRYIFPTQDELLLAVADDLGRRLAAGIARRASDYSRKDQAVPRMVAALPLTREQEAVWRVETAFRLSVAQDPRLSDVVDSSRAARVAECREMLAMLAEGVEGAPPNYEFEMLRTTAMMEGLSEQLCSGGGVLKRDDARAILTRHLREVRDAWSG